MVGFEELKNVAKVLQEAGKIEQYKLILETQSKLLEMQSRISNLEGENKELRNKINIFENLKYERNTYWKHSGEGPFCPRCYEKDKCLIHTQRWSPSTQQCPECKNFYTVYPEKQESPILNYDP